MCTECVTCQSICSFRYSILTVVRSRRGATVNGNRDAEVDADVVHFAVRLRGREDHCALHFHRVRPLRAKQSKLRQNEKSKQVLLHEKL